jgi:hypothetical protein
MLTTLLELLGLVLFVAAAFVFGGIALGLAVGGAACIGTALQLERSRR